MDLIEELEIAKANVIELVNSPSVLIDFKGLSYWAGVVEKLSLNDCYKNWELSDNASDYEKGGKERIIELAKDILEDEGFTVEE